MAVINLNLGDCMEAMAQMPDNAYDLAIVDPPYGLKRDGQRNSRKGNGKGRKGFEFKDWDKTTPNEEYFKQLFRVSKNQIIWGANYFPKYLTPSMGWIFWDKGQRIQQSDGELAFSSFDRALRVVTIGRHVLANEGTFHPTQKPRDLYRWLLKNYAKEGDKILDTHGGSMSIAIACHDCGFDLELYELDKDYYKAGVERYNNHIKQGRLFQP